MSLFAGPRPDTNMVVEPRGCPSAPYLLRGQPEANTPLPHCAAAPGDLHAPALGRQRRIMVKGEHPLREHASRPSATKCQFSAAWIPNTSASSARAVSPRLSRSSSAFREALENRFLALPPAMISSQSSMGCLTRALTVGFCRRSIGVETVAFPILVPLCDPLPR